MSEVDAVEASTEATDHGFFSSIFATDATGDSPTVSDRASGAIQDVLGAGVTEAGKDLTSGIRNVIDGLTGSARTPTNAPVETKIAMNNWRSLVRNPVTWVIVSVVVLFGVMAFSRKK